MRIGRQTAARFQFAAEILQLLRGEAPLKKGSRIHAGRRMALEINRVAFKFIRAGAEEMIESDFVKCGGRGESGNVAANTVVQTIGAHDHSKRVPTDKALDAALELLVTRKGGLHGDRNRIGVGRVCGKREVNTCHGGMCAEAFE